LKTELFAQNRVTSNIIQHLNIKVHHNSYFVTAKLTAPLSLCKL